MNKNFWKKFTALVFLASIVAVLSGLLGWIEPHDYIKWVVLDTKECHWLLLYWIGKPFYAATQSVWSLHALGFAFFSIALFYQLKIFEKFDLNWLFLPACYAVSWKFREFALYFHRESLQLAFSSAFAFVFFCLLFDRSGNRLRDFALLFALAFANLLNRYSGVFLVFLALVLLATEVWKKAPVFFPQFAFLNPHSVAEFLKWLPVWVQEMTWTVITCIPKGVGVALQRPIFFVCSPLAFFSALASLVSRNKWHVGFAVLTYLALFGLSGRIPSYGLTYRYLFFLLPFETFWIARTWQKWSQKKN